MSLWPAKLCTLFLTESGSLCALTRGRHEQPHTPGLDAFPAEIRLSYVVPATSAEAHCFTGSFSNRCHVGLFKPWLFTCGLGPLPPSTSAATPFESELSVPLMTASYTFFAVHQFFDVPYDPTGRTTSFDRLDLANWADPTPPRNARIVALASGQQTDAQYAESRIGADVLPFVQPRSTTDQPLSTWRIYDSSMGYEPPGIVAIYAKPFSSFPRGPLSDYRHLHESDLDEWSNVWVSAALGEVSTQVIYEWLDRKGIDRCVARHVQWRA